MQHIHKKIPLSLLKSDYCSVFGSMTKAVVDIAQGVLVVDAELHSDEEALLLERGSRQEDLWGINLYPDKPREDFIEYTSFINIRPAQDNLSMDIQSSVIKDAINNAVLSLVDFDA